MKNLPSQKQLTKLFSYNPDTGELVWKQRCGGTFKTFNVKHAGTPAGSVCKRGKNKYLAAQVDGSPRYVHRLIFKLVTGRDPLHVDHIDGDGLNNKWVNLREADNRQNQGNRKAKQNRKYKKCTRKIGNRWAAFMTQNSKFIHLGYHDTEEDAHIAYCNAAKEYFGEFFRGK